ncbi:methyltransferase domain-containing protein [Halovivax gelatinilyticus]|uniref:methyltransferase domain-containing protein n=1 Tax=Halovivax gelatinilyticus TaxID=2961597 RepID=UPI0020CA4D38|nr:methyltransferase domain-containing protein [Halovivax gelatinilyticus]
MARSLDVDKLEREVKAVYRDVAETPDGEFHFEMGRPLAARLGYRPADLEWAPDEAIDSFAGVGYHFDLADLRTGEDVLDLGSGSGMDVFVAAGHVGENGSVAGLDMTDEQLANARRLRDEMGFQNVSFERGYVEELPFDDETFDVVVSNGVINLSAAKDRVFSEMRRVLKPGGRIALSDIVSERRLSEGIKTDADLWAACIGGAEQVDDYASMIETPGFEIDALRDNSQYEFTSDRAKGACHTYGVKSISLTARSQD